MARVHYHRVHAQDRQQRKRTQLAQEAARLMTELGMTDVHQARSKAAQRLGMADSHELPRQQEIEKALRERQRLFHAAQHPQQLIQQREAAIEAMRFLQPFQPRLFAEVLEGTASKHSCIKLQVFHDCAEQFYLWLQEQGIPCAWQDRPSTPGASKSESLPVFSFIANELAFELWLLPLRALRQPRLTDLDGRPLARATITEVEMLLHADSDVEPHRSGR